MTPRSLSRLVAPVAIVATLILDAPLAKADPATAADAGAPTTPAPASPAADTPVPPAATTSPVTTSPPSISTPPAAPPAAEGSHTFVFERPGKRYTTWDANLEGALGRVFEDPAKWYGFGRARAGILWVRDPNFFSLGVTYELSKLSSATLGLQAEWMNLETGVWAQTGPLVDVDNGGRLGVMGAVGWSLLGVEVQGRDLRDAGFVGAVYLKLRIPIGVIAFGIRGR